MMNFRLLKLVLIVEFILVAAGCATTSSAQKNSGPAVETPEDVQSAVTAVREAIRNRDASAQYCPLCGKHYSGHLDTCPEDKTPLKSIEE